MATIIAKHWRAMIGALGAALVVAYLGLSLLIGWQVRGAIAAAQESRGGGAVSALVAVAQATEAPVAERNRAIWALGQLGAEEALPVLESLMTEEACDHASRICQHELRKAVEECSGSFNAGALIWRRGDLAVR